MMTDPSTDRPTSIERLGRYKIVRPLSKGGMALVYEARRESLAGVSPRVAIKLILPEHESSETFRELFINEARLGASMHHQNLVQIQDFDCDGDRYFLVMEYVEGLTLRRIISLCQKHGLTMPMGVIAELGRQACDGLHYAHGAHDDAGLHLKLVHRDIKPSNLILGPHGVVKVLDFGISKGRLRRERQGSVKGTWGYMAPEQAMGESVQPTADVFGLAVCLYELASLRPMFQDKGKDEIKRLLKDDHAARMAATLDVAWAPLIPVLVRALQRDPKARYTTAEDLGRALSSLLPDPITSRDEVKRFYETVCALDEGKVPPQRAVVVREQPSQASLIADEASEPHASSVTGTSTRGWVLGMVAATGVAAVLLAVVVVAAIAILQGLPMGGPIVAPGTEPSLQDVVFDEPSGPAGEGAPGEAAALSEGGRERPPPRASGGQDAVSAPAELGSSEEIATFRLMTPQALGMPEPGTIEEVIEEEPARVLIDRRPTVEGEAPVARIEMAAPPVPATAPVQGAAGAAASGIVSAVEEVAPGGPAGMLYVDSKQQAEVYIAGQFVDYAPVKKDLPPGRYAVSIVALDGRRRSFEVEIVEGERVRRTWDFERMEWR